VGGVSSANAKYFTPALMYFSSPAMQSSGDPKTENCSMASEEIIADFSSSILTVSNLTIKLEALSSFQIIAQIFILLI